ncbi:MAG TPA: ATP-binding protein, partial [Cyclobacteriaceae bacterium]|nr:ATP-binding protein [Cyclobacteriaceae bacterium]
LRSHVGNLNSLLHLHKTSDPGEREILFGMFEKVAQHLSGTLHDLIESLRIKEDISKERNLILFEQVLTKTREILASQLLETQAVINYDFKVKSVAYPRTYLESIFLNILSNAIKYRSPERLLEISLVTEMNPEGLVLKISDNGQGINLARHGENLFGFYKTFHDSKDAKGIGLFITRTQIEAMGGTISAESEVNKGTSFKIILQNNVV